MLLILLLLFVGTHRQWCYCSIGLGCSSIIIFFSLICCCCCWCCVLRVATAACNTVSVATSAAPASTPLLPLSLLMLQSYCYSCLDTHNIIFFSSVTCKKINHDVNGGYLSTCVHYCYELLNFFGTNSGALYIKMYCNGYMYSSKVYQTTKL